MTKKQIQQIRMRLKDNSYISTAINEVAVKTIDILEKTNEDETVLKCYSILKQSLYPNDWIKINNLVQRLIFKRTKQTLSIEINGDKYKAVLF